MINFTPFTTYTGEENLCQEIPSYQSFYGGITTSKTSRVPLQETSRSVHSSWPMHETVLEVTPTACLEFNQTRFVKKSQIISKFDPENPGASTHSMARKAQSQKQPNQFILETTPTAPRSTTSFRPISTGDQMINIQPKFNVPAANYNNTQKFHCFEDKVGELVIPVLKDKRDPNLDYITPKTLVEELMNNPKFELHILDCRYDYEFRGGHITNAINVTGLQFLQENLFSAEMLGKAKNDSRQMETENILAEEGSPEKETIIVLYCEFTQKRAPQVQRALRNIDRKLSNWPDLYYPHVYLLEGGYSKFYEQYPEVCDPNGYVEMLDLSYKKEYRAAKERESRAWNPRANFDLEDPDTFTLRSSKRREDF